MTTTDHKELLDTFVEQHAGIMEDVVLHLGQSGTARRDLAFLLRRPSDNVIDLGVSSKADLVMCYRHDPEAPPSFVEALARQLDAALADPLIVVFVRDGTKPVVFGIKYLAPDLPRREPAKGARIAITIHPALTGPWPADRLARPEEWVVFQIGPKGSAS